MKLKQWALIACFALPSATVIAGSYTFTTEHSLKENIDSFLQTEGWQLVWEYPADMPILAVSNYEGCLTCPEGVLVSVINSVDRTADFGAMRIEFDRFNKVVRISRNSKNLTSERDNHE